MNELSFSSVRRSALLLTIACLAGACTADPDLESFGTSLTKPVFPDAPDSSEIARLPALDRKRYQPMESLARLTVRTVTGKEEFLGTMPMDVWLHWSFRPELARTERWIKLPSTEGSASILGVPVPTEKVTHVSFDWLLKNEMWRDPTQELIDRRNDKESLSRDETIALRLFNRYAMFARTAGLIISDGKPLPGAFPGFWPVVPPPEAPVAGVPYDWFVPAVATAQAFQERRPYLRLQRGSPGEARESQRQRWDEERYAPVASAVSELRERYRSAATTDDAAADTAFVEASKATVSALSGLGYPAMDESKERIDPDNRMAFPGMEWMDREVTLNHRDPFSSGRFYYFAAFLIALLAVVFRKGLAGSLWRWAAVLSLAATAAFHGWGLIERTLISQRAMIGTLYESFLFTSLACAVLALIAELIWPKRWFVLSGATLGLFGLFVSQVQPDFWLPDIAPLQPVLINNDLIHIHVPTIMTSYAVLAITILLGHIWMMAYWIERPEPGKAGKATATSELGGFYTSDSRTPRQRELATFMFWTIPVGAALLFVGIILGGVWADMSWGRFWGWDPKETASLIMWLVFMIIVHGRWAGWLRDMGTAMGTIAGSLALWWTWYGANFYQKGLHSYAAASDSVTIPTWTWVYFAVEALFILTTLAVWYHRSSAAQAALAQGTPPPAKS